jgi:hypothetical protein
VEGGIHERDKQKIKEERDEFTTQMMISHIISANVSHNQ